MSNLMKLAIPLLHPDITKKDIDECSGFVEAYFEDKNKPYLTNHLFLMYDIESKQPNVATCFYKLQHLNNRYGTRVVSIKGKQYIVYYFTIDKTIRNLRDGNIILSVAQKQRILDFWGHSDAWVTNNVLLGTMYEHPEPLVLPEEDWAPEEDGYEEGEAF